VVFSSGRRDERNFIQPGTFMFKAEPVDQYGNLIDRHNLWEMVACAIAAAVPASPTRPSMRSTAPPATAGASPERGSFRFEPGGEPRCCG
jgi:hypothetical protein